MDRSRFSFQTRPPKNGRPAYLIWRNPFTDGLVRRQLDIALRAWQADFNRSDTPRQITLGDYVEQPDGRVGFVPRAGNPLALAALRVEAVQRRIAEDLALHNGAD